MPEKYITEGYLRDNHSLGWGTELHLPTGSRLTPSASQLIAERHIRIKFIDESGKVFLADSNNSSNEKIIMVHPLTSSNTKPGENYCGLCNQRIEEKPDILTWLDSDKLVPKNHPRIAFRGKIDTMLSYMVLLQSEFEEFDGDVAIKKYLDDLRSFMGNILRAEVKNERLEPLYMGKIDEKAIHKISHNPMKYLEHDHIVPKKNHGIWVGRINYLRALVREAEVSASLIFMDEGLTVLRSDIINGLNRLSSALYVLMIMVLISAGGKEIKFSIKDVK